VPDRVIGVAAGAVAVAARAHDPHGLGSRSSAVMSTTAPVYRIHNELSPTLAGAAVGDTRSKQIRRRWETPTGLTSGVRYSVILDALGTTASGDRVADRTPLTGTVRARRGSRPGARRTRPGPSGSRRGRRAS
jgi:hypothetical protein